MTRDDYGCVRMTGITRDDQELLGMTGMTENGMG